MVTCTGNLNYSILAATPHSTYVDAKSNFHIPDTGAGSQAGIVYATVGSGQFNADIEFDAFCGSGQYCVDAQR